MNHCTTNVKGIISINGEVIGECKDVDIDIKSIEEEADEIITYIPKTVEITATISDNGHFENGRWVSLPTQIDRIMRPLPVTKFGISISHLTPIFEKGRHIRDDKVTESLGEFTSEQIKVLKFIGVL